MREGIAVPDPKSYAQRASVAEGACSRLNIQIPCLVDSIDDAVNRAYAAWPDRLYIISSDGRIALKGERGPWGFAPSIRQADQWLSRL